MFKTKPKIQIIIIILLLFLPVIVSARGLVPCGGPGENVCTLEDAFVLLARVTNFLIAAAGLLAVFLIMNNSLWLIMSVGNEETLTQHKGAVMNAIIGFILCMFAFMIVNFVVNFILLNGSSLHEATPLCRIDMTNPLNYLTISYPCKPTAK